MSIFIGGQEILSGESKTVEIKIGMLPTGSSIYIQAYVYRAEQEGPVVLLSGGMHGDEINGIEVVRRMIAMKKFNNLLRGTIIAIPLLNIYGFINFSRAVPDGKDVNRSFPGSKFGSLASRVARIINDEILPIIDIGIDYHCGGDNRFNYPQLRISPNDKNALQLAKSFAPDFILKMKPIKGSLRKMAGFDDKPILIYEGGESLRIDDFAIDSAINGTDRVLVALGMKKVAVASVSSPTICESSSWVRASTSGVFLSHRKSGAYVTRGELLGEICDPYGRYKKKIVARNQGYIIGHNNTPIVFPGDALFHIAVKSRESEKSDKTWGF